MALRDLADMFVKRSSQRQTGSFQILDIPHIEKTTTGQRSFYYNITKG